MAKLSQKRIALLWISQGGDPRKADLASAVAMAESGGDTKIYNGVCCHGLYQFHQDYFSVRCATSPACATRLAIKHSKNGTDWGIWEAYTNGAYRSHLGKSGVGDGTKFVDLKMPGIIPDIPFPGPDVDPTRPDLGFGSDIIGSGAGAVADLGIPGISDLAKSIQGVNAFFTGLGELILTPEGWLRTGKLVGGSILVFWGLRVVIRESTGTDPVKAATNTAKKGVEIAALAATVK